MIGRLGTSRSESDLADLMMRGEPQLKEPVVHQQQTARAAVAVKQPSPLVITMILPSLDRWCCTCSWTGGELGRGPLASNIHDLCAEYKNKDHL